MKKSYHTVVETIAELNTLRPNESLEVWSCFVTSVGYEFIFRNDKWQRIYSFNKLEKVIQIMEEKDEDNTETKEASSF